MDDLARKKRVMYWIVGVAVLIVVGFWLYGLLIRSGGAPGAPGQGPTSGGVPGFPRPTPGQTPPEGPLPEPTPPAATTTPVAEQRILQLTDFPVVGPSLNKQEDKVLFYKKEGGDLYRTDFDGQTKEKISNITILGLLDAVWSQTKDRAALRYLDRDVIKGFLHIGTSSVAVLPQDIKSIAWAPDGRALAYLLIKDDQSNLVIADAAGQNPRVALQVPIIDLSLDWVSSNSIALMTAPSGLAEGYVFTYSRASGALNQIVGPVFGLTARWAPDGSRVLISSTSREGKGMSMFVLDKGGRRERQLSFATLPEKCLWADARELYCALPTKSLAQWVLPDDYLQGEVLVPDSLHRIDVDTGAFSSIPFEGDFTIATPFMTKDKSYFFFVNQRDGTLWRIKLK